MGGPQPVVPALRTSPRWLGACGTKPGYQHTLSDPWVRASTTWTTSPMRAGQSRPERLGRTHRRPCSLRSRNGLQRYRLGAGASGLTEWRSIAPTHRRTGQETRRRVEAVIEHAEVLDGWCLASSVMTVPSDRKRCPRVAGFGLQGGISPIRPHPHPPPQNGHARTASSRPRRTRIQMSRADASR